MIGPKCDRDRNPCCRKIGAQEDFSDVAEPPQSARPAPPIVWPVNPGVVPPGTPGWDLYVGPSSRAWSLRIRSLERRARNRDLRVAKSMFRVRQRRLCFGHWHRPVLHRWLRVGNSSLRTCHSRLRVRHRQLRVGHRPLRLRHPWEASGLKWLSPARRCARHSPDRLEGTARL